MAKKSKPKLIVFFDTNALFTQVSSDLVRNEIRSFIQENSNHLDLEICWFLPEVVIKERRFQMLERARDLLPNLQKMERLLGHTFSIGEDTLELHVDKAIENSTKQLNINIARLNADKVDWSDLIERSTSRQPPFERGDKEKGFRDAIIANIFSQTHDTSPSTPSVCLLAIITSDERLIEYISELKPNTKNIRTLKSLEELESLVNTLTSNISEDFAKELGRKAEKLFFLKDDEKSIYYKDNIAERINSRFSETLNNPIIPGHLRKFNTWWITAPIFVKKNRQRIHWISVVEPEFEIYHYEPSPTGSSERNSTFGLSGSIPPPTKARQLGLLGGLESLLGSSPGTQIIDHKGRERFEVHWSASVTQSKTLTKPTIDEIKYLGNTLESDP